MISQLVERGYAVVDGFLGAESARALYEFEQAAWQRGDFRAAGVSRGAARIEDQRKDFTRWLSSIEEGSGPHAAFFAALHELREPLREELHLTFGDQEFHASVYPPGAFYRRHVDTFADARPGPRRLLSFVYYLNPDWEPADGGELALWPEGAAEPELISPVADRLLVFSSAQMAHEVRASLRRERYALTGWWRSR